MSLRERLFGPSAAEEAAMAAELGNGQERAIVAAGLTMSLVLAGVHDAAQELLANYAGLRVAQTSSNQLVEAAQRPVEEH